MGRADDLGRLREEIEAGHRERVEFVANVRNACLDMRKANQAANKERGRTVRAMLAASESTRKQAAQRLSGELMRFVGSVRQWVAELRRANQAENAAAHEAWCGAGAAKPGLSERR